MLDQSRATPEPVPNICKPYTLLGHVPPQQEVRLFLSKPFGDLRVSGNAYGICLYTFSESGPNRL